MFLLVTAGGAHRALARVLNEVRAADRCAVRRAGALRQRRRAAALGRAIVHDRAPVSYTHLTLPTNREV